VSDPSARGWEAVDHAEERLQTRAAARQRAADRRRRRRGWVVWALRALLPLAGAAGALAVLEGSRRSAGVLAAIVLVPAVVAGALARRDGALEALLWALVTLAAEIALVFAVGLVALGLGPG
jgi:hypothetical protein